MEESKRGWDFIIYWTPSEGRLTRDGIAFELSAANVISANAINIASNK